MLLYYCDHEPLPLPSGHKFPIEKYGMLRALLASDPAFGFEPAPLAATEDIELAHDPSYVRGVMKGTLSSVVFRRIGFPWSAQMVRRTLCSAGATLSATSEALRNGYGGSLAGGTHHAFYSEGSGFCVFNDIAIAIRKHAFRRSAVIDLDVHQGDGTAAIFEGDSSVFTLSLHGAANFPFRKQRSTLDVPFADGTGDNEYLEALKDSLSKVWAFEPEIVFYQAGVDALATDKLGRLAMTPAGLALRDRLVFEGCKQRNLAVVQLLGGGYSNPIENTVAAHAQTFRIAAELFQACSRH